MPPIFSDQIIIMWTDVLWIAVSFACMRHNVWYYYHNMI